MAVEVTEFRKGDRVRNTSEANRAWYGRIEKGALGTVTSVRSKFVRNVRFDGYDYVVEMETSHLEAVDPEEMARIEAEREAAEREFRPQDGDILPDDPRLAWLWRAAARAAEKANHCSEYDRLCDELGIPGRERNFGVTVYVNGLKMSVNVKAQSKKLAQAKVLESVPNATLSKED